MVKFGDTDPLLQHNDDDDDDDDDDGNKQHLFDVISMQPPVLQVKIFQWRQCGGEREPKNAEISLIRGGIPEPLEEVSLVIASEKLDQDQSWKRRSFCNYQCF